jgi:ABC-2 type transport system ATP-binding protein
MKRRLEIARGLLVKPKVLFLDEPTIGLDTQTRKRIWSYIKKVNREGVTVFLTTHYMDEADQNSDIICIMDKGKIIANGTPENLKKSIGQGYLHLQTSNDKQTSSLLQEIADIIHIQNSPDGLIVHLKENTHLLTNVIDALRAENIEILSIKMVEPTLDDVFIHYTGRGLGEVNPENTGHMGHTH